MEHPIADIAIVGGGIVGAATAWQLRQRWPGIRLVLLEKEQALAAHQTGHNSGVLHSGIYYKPGSLRARNCTVGRQALVDFCQAEGIAHDVCGKVIAAATEDELPRLRKILATGQENGLTGLKELSAAEVREIEPNVRAVAGLWVPQTGIVDFPAATRRLAERALAAPGSRLLTGHRVLGIARRDGVYTLHTSRGPVQARWLLTCGGLQSDRLARMDGLKPKARIVGFRGDYYDLAPGARHLVRNLIYPVPDPQFPFLGVHFTRMVHGGVECGPNAVFTFDREGYGRTDFSLRDTAAALGYGGTWRFFGRHWRYGYMEYRRAFSKQLFLKTLQRLMPSLSAEHLVPGRSGVRAMALGPDGQMLDDFVFEQTENALHVLNAPSPAATACLAIGDTLAGMCARWLNE